MIYRTLLEHLSRACLKTSRLARILSLASLAHLIPEAHAQYYISEQNGTDNLPGGTEGDPWRTIAYLQSQVPDLPNESTVYFERGGTYRGSFSLYGKTGITFTAYGTGAAPRILGSIPLADAGWAQNGPAGRYRIQHELPSTKRVAHVYDEGVQATRARFPNVDDPVHVGGWLRMDPGSTPTSLTDADLSQLSYSLADATAVIRTANWQYDVIDIQSSTATQLNYVATGPVIPNPNGLDWGYFLRNKLEMLDQPREWYHEKGPLANDDWLYYWSQDGQAPTGVEIAVETLLDGFWSHEAILFYNCTNSTVTDLGFERYAETGIQFLADPPTANCNVAVIRNCTFSDLGNGIVNYSLGEVRDHIYEENVFQRLHNSGISSKASRTVIANNVFVDIALEPGLGASGGGHVGVASFGDDCHVHHNSFVNIGFSGINMKGDATGQPGMVHSVDHNSITNALATLNDGGGIFFDDCNGLMLERNIVTDVRGNWQSTATQYATGYPYLFRKDTGIGIYSDEEPVKNTTVRDNTVSGCSTGMIIDHTHEAIENPHTVQGNTLFNNDTQLNITDWSNHITGDPAGGAGVSEANYVAQFEDTYSGNIMYSLNEDQVCMSQIFNFWPTAPEFSDAVDFGTFTGNYYYNPFNPMPIEVTAYLADPLFGVDIPFTLEQWSLETGDDANASGSPLSLSSNVETGLTGGTPFFFDNFSTDLAQWLHPPFNCLTLDTSDPLHPLDDGTNTNALSSLGADFGTGFDCEWIYGQNQTPDLGIYRLRFLAKASEEAVLVAGIIDDQTNNTPGKSVLLSTQPREFKLYFDASEMPHPLSSLYPFFRHARTSVGISDATIWLDEVEIRECTFSTPDVSNDHILRYNNPLGDASDPQNVYDDGGILQLVGCWSMVDGTIVSGDIPLDEWESIVLYRVETVYDIDVATYDVQGNETWTTDRTVRGSVVVGAGETLTIDNCTIGFADTRQDEEVLTNILVQPGGTLEIINGAVLTTIAGCGDNSMWDGVKALGTTDPEGPTGDVIAQNSTIRNALTAILCGEGDPMDPGYAGPVQPGRFFVSGCTLENNRHDIVRHGLPGGGSGPTSYQHMHIGGNVFKTTAPLNYSHLDPVSHLRIADQYYVFLAGNTFANDIGTHTQSHRMAKGIDALNSNLRVWAPNTFRNLDHAIHSVTTATGIPQFTAIDNCIFEDNICAVYLSGLTNAWVANNQIRMGKWNVDMTGNIDETFWQGKHRGVFTTRCNSLTIMDNTLERTSEGTAPCEGIVVGYTGAENEVVFRNNATDLDIAYVGEGECADVDNDPAVQGLQFQCDENTNNAVNFKSRRANGATTTEQLTHTIRGRQGTTAISASNSFSGADHFVIDTRATALEYVEYSYAPGQAPTTYTLPNATDPDADYMTINDVPTAIACGTGEPVYLVGTGTTYAGVKPHMAQRKQTYGNLSYLHANLIDGGNTNEVVDEITSAWPQDVWDLRAYLLAQSPYLSVEVLKELVNKDMPLAMKAEVLIANPDATKKEGFLKWAELEANYPLPTYIVENIMASWDTHTYRTQLEEQMADAHTRLTQVVYKALRLLVSDSFPPPPDTLRWVWQQLRTPGARFAEAALLMGQARYTEADAMLAAMHVEKPLKPGEESERDRLRAYIDILASAAANGRYPYTLNAADLEDLEELVSDRYDRPAVWASNLLCAVYGSCRAPFTGDVAGAKADRTREHIAAPQPTASSSFGIQPNPARAWVAFTYAIADAEAEQGSIVIRDLAGRVVHSLPMYGPQGQVLWDVRDVAPGTYLVQCLRGQELLHTEKLIIQQ